MLDLVLLQIVLELGDITRCLPEIYLYWAPRCKIRVFLNPRASDHLTDFCGSVLRFHCATQIVTLKVWTVSSLLIKSLWSRSLRMGVAPVCFITVYVGECFEHIWILVRGRRDTCWRIPSVKACVEVINCDSTELAWEQSCLWKIECLLSNGVIIWSSDESKLFQILNWCLLLP